LGRRLKYAARFSWKTIEQMHPGKKKRDPRKTCKRMKTWNVFSFSSFVS